MRYIFLLIIILIIILICYLFYKTPELFAVKNFNCSVNMNKDSCTNQQNCVWCNKTKSYNNITFFNRTYCDQKSKNDAYRVSNKIYKVKLDGVKKILRENCYSRCPQTQCKKLYSYIQSAEDCLKCQKNKNNCYHKEMVSGYCSPCAKNKKQKSCMLVNKFGCPDSTDLNNMTGVMPYYYEVSSNNANSAYNTECKFCWNLK